MMGKAVIVSGEVPERTGQNAVRVLLVKTMSLELTPVRRISRSS
jgi:hypothetical protein